MISSIKEVLEKNVFLGALSFSFSILCYGFSLESDLNDRSVVIFFVLVVILESQERLDQVPVLVFHVFGLSPLLTSLVVRNVPVCTPVSLHDVVTHDVSSRSGLCLVKAADDYHEDEDEKLGEKHDD